MKTYKEVSNSRKFLSIDKADGLEGIYVGPSQGKFRKNYQFNVNGESLVVNGCASLDKVFEKVAEGSQVRIEYKGSETIQSGQWKGRPWHNVKVFVAEEDGLVEGVGPQSETAQTNNKET